MKKTMLSTKQSYLVCFIGILAAFGIVMALCESGLADSYIKGIMMTACIAIIMTTSLIRMPPCTPPPACSAS